MVEILLLIPILLISLTVHEYSHAMMAHLLGDDTAKNQGRLTLNPLKHLDPVGTIFFFFMHFGWAKPVPVDTRNLRDPHRDMLFIAAAGPASNLTIAIIVGLVLRGVQWSPLDNQMGGEEFYTLAFLCLAVYCNVALAVFNMLPVFPLDGSSVLKGLLPRRMAQKLSELDKFAGMALLGVFLMDQFAGTHFLGAIFRRPIGFMVELLTQDAFPMVNRLLGL